MILKIIIFFFSLFCFFSVSAYTEDTIDPASDITSSDFTISVDAFPVGNDGMVKTTAEETLNNALAIVIKNLMVALGFISLAIMTIGAGYMIAHHGEDEYLTKGKKIFMAGIVSLIIALSSYYIVNMLGYLLYK